MALHDPAAESSAHRRQSLPSLPFAPPSDSAGNTSPDLTILPTDPTNTNNPSSSLNLPQPPSQPQESQHQPARSSPSLTPDSPNSSLTTPVAAAPITLPSPLPETPANSPAPTNSSTDASSKRPTTPTPNSSPLPASATPVSTANNTLSTSAAAPKVTGTTTSPPAAAATPTHVVTSDPSLNTIPYVSSDNARPVATPHRNLPTSAPPPQDDNSGGLSGGAITGIAIVAGIVGFILLFWVGVQLLQSKRRRREEAEMEEIDFHPSGGGGGSVNGGMSYPRNTRSLDRQPSASNSFNYNKDGGQAHFAKSQYGDAPREEGEYIDPPLNQEFEPSLQRQATLGGSSAYSAGCYNNPVPGPPAPYTNYSPYSHQFGMQPPHQMYEPRPYEYTMAGAPSAEYPHGHGHSNPPSSIAYQH